jgi:cell division protein FtsI/penicillin-binding protein 2
MNSKQRFRTRIVGLGILAGAGILLSSLYMTSIIRGNTYAAKAAAQYAKPATSLFSRGTIFFTGKDGTESAAATVETGNLLYLNPKQITDVNGEYAALSHVTPVDKQAFMQKATKPNDSYEELAHHLDDATADAVRELGLKGVNVTAETWRSYPGKALASHELGLIGEDAASSTVTGRYGLERSYDDVLSRANSGSDANVFAQIFSGLDSVFGGGPDSGDVVTTIEPTVQTYLEKVLSKTQDEWHPDEIGGVIMDPNTGEIYAMGSHPTFDPNDLKSVKSTAVLSNPLVEHVYEMGSIMKPLTMAAALDSGAVKPDTTYDDTGCLTLNQKRICNYDQKARGVIPMQQILSQSLNVGAATIAMKTGPTDFPRYFFDFGLDKKSGIDLPNEAKPISGSLKNPKDIDIATASYGQGIAVTPVGMARMLSLLANGGYLVTPHLVKEIDKSDGTVEKIEPPRSGPYIRPETDEEVKRMLVTVVDTALANGALKKDHYTMAAKTGTAEIADHVNGGYYSDRWLHSFFGFFPAYQPRFIVFLYQIYPKGAKYASETLTKPFDDLATFLINYYNIPPDR